MMKLLLASAGINNTSIRTAVVDLLGKPKDATVTLDRARSRNYPKSYSHKGEQQ